MDFGRQTFMDFEGPALVVGAHPDDTDFGAGGTVAAFTAAGHAVHYVVCTDGSKGTKERGVDPRELARRRRYEQCNAAEALGVASVTFLEQIDGELENTRPLRLRLARRIREVRPHVLLTHDPWRPRMLHPDHRAAGFAVIDAVVAARDHLYLPELLREGLEPWPAPELWLWDTIEWDLWQWDTVVCDHWVDIGGVIDRKLAALRCHESQIGAVAALEERLRRGAREIGAPRGLAFAEGFKRLAPR